MDVRIDFTGDARDAQAAAVSMDKALEGIEGIAKQVAAALDDIRLDLRQVLEVQAGARAIGSALREVTVRGTDAAEAVGRVGRGFGRQSAEVVAGSAAASAALRGLEAQARSTHRSLIDTAVLGGTAPAVRPAGGLLAAAVRGETFSGQYNPPRFSGFPYNGPARTTGFVSAPRPGTALELYRDPTAWARDLVFGTSGAIPMGMGGSAYARGTDGSFLPGRPRMTHHFDGFGDRNDASGRLVDMVGGVGNFGLSTSGRRRLGGFGPIVGGGGGFFGGGGILSRFGDHGSDGGGIGGFFSRGNGYGGGALAGILPGGARAGPAALGALAGAGIAAGPTLLPALGVLAAIPGLAGTGAAALGALVAAFHGVGAAIGGNADAYKALNAEQQQFVLTARGLSPILDKIRDAATGGLLPGATAGLRQAFSPAAQSTLTTGLGQVGGAIGGSLNELGGLMGSKFFTGLQSDLFKSGAKNIREIGDAVVSLVSAVTSFAHGAQPITDWLVHTADLGARWLANWTRMKDETGAFNGLLALTKTAWGDLIAIGGAVVRIVADFAGILGGAGKVAITGLIDGLEGLDSWLRRNREALSGFATTIAKDLVEAIQTVGPLLLGLLTQLGNLLNLLRRLPGPLKAIGDAVVVAGIIGLAGGFSAMAASVGLVAKSLPLLQTALLALVANPEIAALIAALGGAAYLIDKVASHTTPSQLFTKKGKGPDGSDLYVENLGGGHWQTYNGRTGSDGMPVPTQFHDITEAQAAKLLGVSPKALQRMVSAKQPQQSGGGGDFSGGHGFTATGAGQVYAAGKNVDLGHENPALMSALNQLSQTTGLRFQVTSGYRSYDKQKYLWDHAAELGLIRGVSVAKPGSSAHESGNAADVMAIVNGRPVPITEAVSAGALAQVGLTGIGPRDAVHVQMAATGSGAWKPGTVPQPKSTAGWQLPIPLQIALARAQTTSGFGDDRTAIGAAMRGTRSAIAGGLQGADLVNAYQELKSLQDMLASIAKATRGADAGKLARSIHIPTPASEASVLSVSRLASGLMGDIGGATKDARQLGLLNLLPGFDKAKQQTAYFNAIISSGFLDSKSLAIVRQHLLDLKGVIGDGLDKIAAAAQARSDTFKSVFEDIAQQAVTGFEKVTNDVLAHPEQHADILPLTAKLLGLQDAHTQQQLQDQLAEAQQNLAKALSGATSDSSGILAAARDKIGKDALAHALDVAQSAVLGINPGDMTDQIIRDMQDVLRAAIPDPAEVEKAQKAVADAQYQITVSGLEKQASAEQDAYRDQRTELEQHLQKSLSLWESYFADLGHDSAQALADLNAVLGKFGLAPLGVGALTTPGGPPSSQDWATQAGVKSGFSPGIPSDMLAGILFGTPGGINPSTGKPYVGFATGGVSLKPQIASVAETGPEAHLPLNDPRALAMVGDAIAKAGGGGNVTVLVNVQDEALRDLIDVEIVRNAPAVSYQQGTNASRLFREGRV